MRLASEMAAIQKVDWDAKRLEVKCTALEQDLDVCRKRGVELESELVGARLDAKYLDKELAGRIQQIQILLAANTSQEHKQKVWSQIETEMHLQRSKTISNMCYSKQRVKDATRSGQQTDKNDKTSNGDIHGTSSDKDSSTSRDPRLKQVSVRLHGMVCNIFVDCVTFLKENSHSRAKMLPCPLTLFLQTNMTSLLHL